MSEINDLFDTPGPVFHPAGDIETPGADDPSSGVRRNSYGWYILPDPARPVTHDVEYPRTTTLVKAASDDYLLHLWDLRMAIHGLTLRPDLYAAVATTPLSDRNKLNSLARDAQTAAGNKARAQLGTAIHAFCEARDKGHDVHVPARWAPEVDAWSRVVDRAGIVFDPEHVERVVAIPSWGIAGTFDRIGTFTRTIRVLMPDGNVVRVHAGQRAIVDLKTGSTMDFSWHETCGQLAAYADAFGMWKPGTREYEPMPDRLRPDVAFVIHVPARENPEDEAHADLLAVNLQTGRTCLQLAQSVREWRTTAALVSRVMLDDQVESVPAAVESACADPEAFVSSMFPEPVPSPPCPAVSKHGTVCVVETEHVRHRTALGTEWVTLPELSEGMACPECERVMKKGKITHVRGCVAAPPRAGRSTRVAPDPDTVAKVLGEVLDRVIDDLQILPGPVSDQIDRAAAGGSTWVRSGRPERQDEPPAAHGGQAGYDMEYSDGERAAMHAAVHPGEPGPYADPTWSEQTLLDVIREEPPLPDAWSEFDKSITSILESTPLPSEVEPVRDAVFDRLQREREARPQELTCPGCTETIEHCRCDVGVVPAVIPVPAVMSLYGPLDPETGKVWADGLGTYVLPGETIVRCPCGAARGHTGDRCDSCATLRRIADTGDPNTLIEMWKRLKAAGEWDAEVHGPAAKARRAYLATLGR